MLTSFLLPCSLNGYTDPYEPVSLNGGVIPAIIDGGGAWRNITLGTFFSGGGTDFVGLVVYVPPNVVLNVQSLDLVLNTKGKYTSMTFQL